MEITDRQIGVLALIVGAGALWYGWRASTQNKEILTHTREIKKNLT